MAGHGEQPFSSHLGLDQLQHERDFACRLTADRALVDVDDAERFVADRGILTLSADCSLPSLFGACHQPPGRPGGRGYDLWPKDRWWWPGELQERPSVRWMRIRRGKGVFLSGAVQAAAAPLFAAALEASDSPLLAHLKSAGPSLVEDVKDELGWDAKRLRSERAALEKVGALVHRGVELPAANGGHIHTAELVRWDQLDVEPTTSSAEDALDALTVAAVRAAVCAPRKEVQRWFSWAPDIDRLIADGRVRAIGDAVACVAP